MGAPLADQELDEYRDRFHGTATSSFLYHYARLIEILAAVERIERAARRPRPRLGPPARRRRDQPARRRGRQRGAARHALPPLPGGRGRPDQRVNLIIATGQNNLAMNRTVAQIARHYIKGPRIPEGVLNRLEAGIRAFDPCLSCSTHAIGMMPLHVQLVAADGTIQDEIWRD